MAVRLYEEERIPVREMSSNVVRGRGCDAVTTIERWMATGECRGLAADELIAVLLDQRQDWAYRAWSVMLLASSNAKATTEALFHASQRDPVYWVRRDALQSLRLRRRDLACEICHV